MGFLDNIFGNNKKNELTSIDGVKSFIISDMEKKWKMHVEKSLQSNSENVASFLYAVQGMKFKGAPYHMEEAGRISKTSMAYGLVPMIKSKKLNIQLTKFLEVYIYFYKNNKVGFLSSLVDGDNDEIIITLETDFENAKKEYETFIKETHNKVFLEPFFRKQ